MNKMLVRALLALSLFVSGFLPALAAAPVRVVYVEWDCARATSTLVKVAIEERLGRDVELIPVSVGVMWTSLATGDADVTVTAWLPAMHGNYLRRYPDALQDLGPLVGGAKVGLVVPDYVPLTSIPELKNHVKRFSNQIIGIDSGATFMTVCEKAIKEYDLTGMILVEGSGTTMTAALADAIRRKEWVVVTGWSPHWMFGRWQLHYLNDPKMIFGAEERIHTVVRKGLDKDMPDVFAFLDKFHYRDTDQLQELMAWNEENNDDVGNARRFMQKYPELTASWFDTGAPPKE